MIYVKHDDGSLELWVYDMHGEYWPSDPPTSKCRIDMIADLFQISEFTSDEVVAKIMENAPANWYWGEGCGGYIYHVSGSIEDVRQLWQTFYKQVLGGPIGADDDIFDYWPGAVDICKQVAGDLDTIAGNTSHMDELRNAYRTKVEKEGDIITEYSFDGDHVWEKQFESTKGA